jgi:acyl-CoA dehydrogenase
MLTEAGRICEEVLAPLNRAGDLHPARLENGVVRTSPGFADGWRAVAEAAGSWHWRRSGAMAAWAADDRDHRVNEMIAGACLRCNSRP